MFHLMARYPSARLEIGTVLPLIMACELFRRACGGYFLNRWDLIIHAAILLDMGLEAWLVSDHSAPGFYYCAMAWAILLGAYRTWGLRRAGLGSEP